MGKSQERPAVAPTPDLADFAAVIQENLAELFESAHDHVVLSANPTERQGSIQMISIVDDGTDVYLVVKTKRGLFKSPNFTAI